MKQEFFFDSETVDALKFLVGSTYSHYSSFTWIPEVSAFFGYVKIATDDRVIKLFGDYELFDESDDQSEFARTLIGANETDQDELKAGNAWFGSKGEMITGLDTLRFSVQRTTNGQIQLDVVCDMGIVLHFENAKLAIFKESWQSLFFKAMFFENLNELMLPGLFLEWPENLETRMNLTIALHPIE